MIRHDSILVTFYWLACPLSLRMRSHSILLEMPFMDSNKVHCSYGSLVLSWGKGDWEKGDCSPTLSASSLRNAAADYGESLSVKTAGFCHALPVPVPACSPERACCSPSDESML